MAVCKLVLILIATVYICTNFNVWNRWWLHLILQQVEFTPFYWEPCDWCQLTYQQLTIPSAWKLHAVTRYLECQIAIHQVCMGMLHSVIPPLGLSLMTDPPSVILKIQRSLRGPKTSSAALDWMPVHPKVTPRIKFINTHLYTWVEKATVRVRLPVQEHSTMSLARF